MHRIIETNLPFEQVSFKHKGEIKNGIETSLDWEDSMENYFLNESNGVTELKMDMDIKEEFEKYFIDTFPKAVELIKQISENKKTKQNKMTNQIYPCLWFDGQAKAAADFYCSIFKNSKITTDTPMVVNFELNGKKFMGLNGGPQYKFSPATSFVVDCETQEDIDFYWEKLGDGGIYNQCGWLDDKYGVSWQIVPTILGKLMADPEKAPRVMKAFMQMKKFDIEKLMNA